MKYRWIAALLLLCLCVGLIPAASADTAYDESISVQAIFETCYDFFAGFEGHYDSVTPKDSNAVSIGRLQWHASRAHALLKKIVEKNPTKMASLLSTSLYNEIMYQADSTWNNRCLTSDEAAQVKAVISTTEGIDAQDEQAYTDICLYISYAYNAGFRSNATIMYYCSVLNQYGVGGAKTYFLYPLREYLNLTADDTIDSLEYLHTAVMECPNINYKTSRQKVYNYIVANTDWNLEGPDEPMDPEPGPCFNGHTWNDGVVTKAPTCTEAGSAKYTCTVCGETTNTPIPALGHSWNDGVTTQPTCTEAGATVYTCTACGATRTDAIDPLGHNYGSDGRCTRCGAVDPGSLAYPSAIFTDVPENAWYRAAVDYALTNGIFSGTSATTFSPSSSMNRAMLVTVVYAMAGKPYESNGDRQIFDDVPVNSYFYKPVLWAFNRYLVNGVTETSFAPRQAITREQLVLILYRFAEYKDKLVAPTRTNLDDFADGGSVSAYAKDAMLWAVENGLIVGSIKDGQKYLKPKSGATRAEVAQILMVFNEKFK